MAGVDRILRDIGRPLAGTLILLLGLSGCQAVSNAPAPSAQLRIIDVSLDAPGVDVYANGGALAYNVSFGTVTSYIPVAAAEYMLNGRAAGNRTVMSTTRAALTDARQYTLLMSDRAASLQTTLLVDQSQPAPNGQVAIRVLNRAMSSGAVDVYLVPEGKTLTQAIPVRQAVPSGPDSTYVDVPAGRYRVVVVPSGRVPSSWTAGVSAGVSTDYPSGSARTLILADRAQGSGTAVQVITANDFDVGAASF